MRRQEDLYWVGEENRPTAGGVEGVEQVDKECNCANAKELADGIVIGSSNIKQLKENLDALKGGPLPEDVVDALNKGWGIIRGKELKYWH